MPSVDNSRRKQRVAESDSEEDDAGGNNDAVLAKVDPEFLNKPIDLQQGQSKLKLIVMGLKTAEKQLGEVANALFDVAQETAEQLSEAYQDGYDEDEMMKVFREDVRSFFFSSPSLFFSSLPPRLPSFSRPTPSIYLYTDACPRSRLSLDSIASSVRRPAKFRSLKSAPPSLAICGHASCKVTRWCGLPVPHLFNVGDIDLAPSFADQPLRHVRGEGQAAFGRVPCEDTTTALPQRQEVQGVYGAGLGSSAILRLACQVCIDPLLSYFSHFRTSSRAAKAFPTSRSSCLEVCPSHSRLFSRSLD